MQNKSLISYYICNFVIEVRQPRCDDYSFKIANAASHSAGLIIDPSISESFIPWCCVNFLKALLEPNNFYNHKTTDNLIENEIHQIRMLYEVVSHLIVTEMRMNKKTLRKKTVTIGGLHCSSGWKEALVWLGIFCYFALPSL